MSKQLLDGVNEVLKRANIISVTGELSGLTDSGRQIHIDTVIQLWNEAVDNLYDIQGEPRAKETGEVNITLVADQREYPLPSDLVQIRYPLIDETNGFYIWEYPGGFERMRIHQPQPSQNTGTPVYATINPKNNKLRLDNAPESGDAGKAYVLLYDKDKFMDDALDDMPFSDAVFRALVPVIVEAFDARRANEFDEREFRRAVGRASSFLTQKQRRTHW